MGSEPFWDVNRSRGGVVQSARCFRRPDVDPVLVGCCEFVGDLVDAVCEGRSCGVDGTFCPGRIFSDVKVFAGCLTRLEKLKSVKEQT